MIIPFVEAGGEVYIVIGWEPDMEEQDKYTLQKLSVEETRRYRCFRRETDIELFINFNSGG